MICSVVGYPDGFTRTFYDKDGMYEIPEALAINFLAGNVAKEYVEEKNLGNAPENKAFIQAPDNKTEMVEEDRSDKPSNGSKKIRKKVS